MRGAPLMRLAALVAALVAACAAYAQGTDDLARIMKALAAQPAATARFSESRTSALLREPIRSAGTLSHGPGGRLEKHTMAPRDERLVVDGGTVTYQRDGGERRTLKLADLPGVLAMIEGLRGTLAGDLDALRRHYRVELQGGYDAWRLFLLPRDPQVAELVSDVRIAGSGGDVREVEIREASGDRSVLTLTRTTP